MFKVSKRAEIDIYYTGKQYQSIKWIVSVEFYQLRGLPNDLAKNHASMFF